MHPEVEIHLIRASRGLALIGDYVGAFEPGHLALVGSGLPHNWISDLAAGETVRGRDVVLQLDPQLVTELARQAPEFRQVQQLFRAADRGIEFTGATARAAADGGVLVCAGKTGCDRLGFASRAADAIGLRVCRVLNRAGCRLTGQSVLRCHASRCAIDQECME